MAWLPVMLRMDGMRCVVVGGGAVAERKVLALLQAAGGRGGSEDGAAALAPERWRMTVISPSLTDKLAELADAGRLEWVRREYRAGDLAGAGLAFAATNAREVNGRVAAEAESCGVWVNVVDDPLISGMLMPAVVRRGRLILAVSTAGASPAAARRIRRELEQRYGPEYEVWLDWIAATRLLLRRCVADTERRQELHRELERLDGPALLASGRLPLDGWQEEWLQALECEPTAQTVRRLAAERGLL